MKDYRNRQWLNPADHFDTGMVASSVEAYVDDDWTSVDVNLSIWDCSRKVNIDLSFSTVKEARQRADKIDLLLRELATIRCKMEEGFEKVYPYMKEK